MFKAKGVSLQQQTDRVKRGGKKKTACVKMNSEHFFSPLPPGLWWEVAVRWSRDESGWDYASWGQQGNAEQTGCKSFAKLEETYVTESRMKQLLSGSNFTWVTRVSCVIMISGVKEVQLVFSCLHVLYQSSSFLGTRYGPGLDNKIWAVRWNKWYRDKMINGGLQRKNWICQS